MEVRSWNGVETMSVPDPSDITTDKSSVDIFGEANETSVEDKNLKIDEALKVFGENWILRKEQRLCVDKLVFAKKDVVALLPTGFGKSIIYQILPQIHKNRGDEKHVVLVVTPLNAIMNEQTKMLRERGMRAAILGDSASQGKADDGEPELPLITDENIKEGDVDIVFGSAEKWMSEEWRRELKDGKLGKLVAEIAVDEVHVVLEWGMTRSQKKKGKRAHQESPFREAFGKLGELRALLPGCPVVALSASLRVSSRMLLQKTLNLMDAYTVNVSPNKGNIRMSAVKVKDLEDALKKLDWLIDLMKEHGIKSPKAIIFCNVMTDIAHVVGYMLLKVGKHACITTDSNMKLWLIGVYHSKSWESSKQHIEGEFSVDGGGKVRVILATTALGMGVNYPDVKYIIQFLSPARTLEGHIQQLGRAGRNGGEAHDITLYSSRGLSQCESDIKKVFNDQKCLRVSLFKHFDEGVTSLTSPKHMCCSVCCLECKCKDVCTFQEPFAEPHLVTGSEEHSQKSRKVSADDKAEMKAALMDERERLTNLEGGFILFGFDSLHGFSDSLILSVTENLQLLFRSEDVIQLLPVFSVKHARIILELVQEFFNDIDDFDDQIEVFEVGERKLEHELELSLFMEVTSPEAETTTEDENNSDGTDSEDETDYLSQLPELELVF